MHSRQYSELPALRIESLRSFPYPWDGRDTIGSLSSLCALNPRGRSFETIGSGAAVYSGDGGLIEGSRLASAYDMGLEPGQLLGPYRLVRLLGAGGMGEVYEAVHDRIARQVAIKILFPDLAKSAEVAGRFLNEARAVNIVRHPGLVQIFDYGQLPDGTTYIVMEFLAGVTLSAHLESKGGTLPNQQVLHIGQQIAQALEAAHTKGIIHRDLKSKSQ